MLVPYFILYVFFVHFIADFVCQTDKMATGKSSSMKALLTHTGTYSLVLYVGVIASVVALFFSGYAGILAGHGFSQLVSYVFVNFLLHTATDYVTSRMTTKLWKAGKRHEFFVVIGADQLLHSIALVATLPILFPILYI